MLVDSTTLFYLFVCVIFMELGSAVSACNLLFPHKTIGTRSTSYRCSNQSVFKKVLKILCYVLSHSTSVGLYTLCPIQCLQLSVRFSPVIDADRIVDVMFVFRVRSCGTAAAVTVPTHTVRTALWAAATRPAPHTSSTPTALCRQRR